MTPIILLRVAAVLASIQGVAHGGLFIAAKPRYGAQEVAVIEAMKTHRIARLRARILLGSLAS